MKARTTAAVDCDAQAGWRMGFGGNFIDAVKSAFGNVDLGHVADLGAKGQNVNGSKLSGAEA